MAMERENRAPRGAGRKRRKVCQFCVDKCEYFRNLIRNRLSIVSLFSCQFIFLFVSVLAFTFRQT